MPLTCKCGDRMQCRASFCCIGCRTLDLEGQLLIAIHRYSHGIIQGTMCPCSRIIALGFLYCSLECKDNHFWN
uniref:Uncharacterized protein n=1 Tax=Oryza meridionalis TaxID=40149 RepID=A0A0E0EW91_9ORYZ